MKRRTAVAALLSGLSFAQDAAPIAFVCPMDPDVRSAKPARCPKCGMKLVAGLPDPKEYRVDLKLEPRRVKPGEPVKMTFRVTAPKSGKPADRFPIARFEVIHDRLFHLFLIGRDLSYFAHEHPQPQRDGSFTWVATLPVGGLYRVLCDFYPSGGTPQMIAKTILLPGPAHKPNLKEDTATKSAENLRISLVTDPQVPAPGRKTMLFFHLEPADGLEPYLGAWGHMLAASADLVDMLHAHPAWEEGGPKIQFNIIFPRPGMHRLWVQFQRLGVVNTVAFNVQVSDA